MGSSFKNYNVALFFSHDHSETYKGQLISKGTFGVFKSTTKPTKNFKWYLYIKINKWLFLSNPGQKSSKKPRCFFRRFEDTLISFWD